MCDESPPRVGTRRRARYAIALVSMASLSLGAHAQSAATTIPSSAGFLIDREIAPGASHRYELALAAGQFADLTIADDAAFVSVTLPDALIVTLVDGSGAERLRITKQTTSKGIKRLCHVADRTEVYSVTVAADPSAKPVRYTLRLEALRAADDADRARARALAEFLDAERLQSERSADAYRRAIPRYLSSLRRWADAGDRSEEAQALHRLGLVYSLTADYPNALAVYERAAALRHELGERLAEGTTLHNMGVTYYRMGNYPAALRYYELALPLRRETNDLNGEASTVAGMGSIYGVSDPVKGLDYQQQAIALWRAAGNREGEALGLHNAGTAHFNLGNLGAALEYLGEALKIRRALGDRTFAADALNQIGIVRDWLGDLDGAVVAAEEALALHRAAGNRRGEGYVQVTLGTLLLRRGDVSGASERFSSAIEILRAIGDRSGEAQALSSSGDSWLRRNDPQQALDLYTREHDILIANGDRRNAASATWAIARANALLGKVDLALTQYADALSGLRAVRDRLSETGTLIDLARFERQIGRLPEARDHADAALGVLESVRTGVGGSQLRESLQSSSQDRYGLYIDLEMQMDTREPGQGHQAAALAGAERARARGLLELLAESRWTITEGVDSELLERERRLTARIAAGEERLTRLLSGSAKPEDITSAERDVAGVMNELREVQREVRTRSPRYAALTQPSPLDLPAIQRLLDPDTVLLEYALGPERSYVWAVTRESLTSAVLPSRDRIEDAARRSHELLSGGARREAQLPTRRALEALADLVLAPVAPALSANRIIVVPDGALQYVPFAALPSPATRRPGARLDEPLVARHEIVTLPSASTLAALRQTDRSSGRAERRLAVFADPVLRSDDPRVTAAARRRQEGASSPAASDPAAVVRSAGEVGIASLERLPYAREEAGAVAMLAGRGRSLKALDFDASRAATGDLGRYQIVHFATHALLNSRHPELSGILLSLVDRDGAPVDGFLRLHDVYNLRLNADLVVLSACRTALGKEIKGEGLVGLTRGFLFAGAPAVVASLWDVRDRSTAELMTRFYRAMLRDGLAPAAALRAAQVSMWRDPRWAAPAHWAGFILQGDWRNPAVRPAP